MVVDSFAAFSRKALLLVNTIVFSIVLLLLLLINLTTMKPMLCTWVKGILIHPTTC